MNEKFGKLETDLKESRKQTEDVKERNDDLECTLSLSQSKMEQSVIIDDPEETPMRLDISLSEEECE